MPLIFSKSHFVSPFGRQKSRVFKVCYISFSLFLILLFILSCTLTFLRIVLQFNVLVHKELDGEVDQIVDEDDRWIVD